MQGRTFHADKFGGARDVPAKAQHLRRQIIAFKSGAKKVRRDHLDRKYYWLNNPPATDDDFVLASDSLWNDTLHVVVDTLVSIGCDGWHRINELLPAYNPLEASQLGPQYTAHNYQDKAATTSIRNQRKGVDDDNDGLIDEDPLECFWQCPF